MEEITKTRIENRNSKYIIDKIIKELRPEEKYDNKTREDIARVLLNAFPKDMDKILRNLLATINNRGYDAESEKENINKMHQCISALRKKQNLEYAARKLDTYPGLEEFEDS